MDMNHGKKETFGRPRGPKLSRQEVQFSSKDMWFWIYLCPQSSRRKEASVVCTPVVETQET